HVSSAPLCRATLLSILIASFFLTDPATTEFYTLSLHDALPILIGRVQASRVGLREAAADGPEGVRRVRGPDAKVAEGVHRVAERSEEHTSELQSRENLVCRLLLEKKKKTNTII